MGWLISIEGGDGVGKTTQAGLLVERLRAAGLDARLVREPGGTPAGEEIRRIVKMDAQPKPLTEMLLFQAARAELVESVIRPQMERDAVVVTDRFTDSSLAYQGYGRGIDLDVIRDLNRIATGGLTPDLTILLDVPPSTALARLGDGSLGGGGPGRNDPAGERGFEMLPPEFHERVAEGYRELAAAEPERWFVVDANRVPDVVAERVWAAISGILDL